MRSLKESRERWQVTAKHATSLEDLKQSVRLDGNDSSCKSGLRSVFWKTFLLFQATDTGTWSRALVDSRGAYTALRDHFLRFIENPDELGSALDPLDDDQHSPWNSLRRDEEMRAEIFQDIERCMPEEAYFREPTRQRIMLDVLFVFCKINQDIGYRQGMHELLAPILWVVEQDAIDNDSTEPDSDHSDSMIKQMLDRRYIEHDSFTLFALIMRSAKSFYELGEPDQNLETPSTGVSPIQNSSPIVERSKRIHEVYLAHLDPELAKHLTDIEVLPQIFLIRWIRLLFGREFPFEDLLALWDTILAEDPGLDLVDLVCVAMLLRIRWELVEANYSMALMLLLKHSRPLPPNGPQSFVDDAVYLRDNLSTAGGVNIIQKYSGKAPSISNSRPSTPLSRSLSPRQRLSNTRSPISSPARFLQQQGGVEALIQGAAKGVYDRGERLGINKAVRDAVGEVRKNMQGLQASRSNSFKKSSDASRWSLDDRKSIPKSMELMNRRNQQLAHIIDQAMSDLRAVTNSTEGDAESYVAAMNAAISKVDLVKLCLEDTAIPLPLDSSDTITSSHGVDDPKPQPASNNGSPPASPNILVSSSGTEPEKEEPPTNERLVSEEEEEEPKSSSHNHLSIPSLDGSDSSMQQEHLVLPDRPKAPVPPRSSLAQSSFAWMLEDPDISSNLGAKRSLPKTSSPFLKNGKRAPGSSRERAAFLFGGDGEGTTASSPKLQTPVDVEEAFKLRTIRGPKGD